LRNYEEDRNISKSESSEEERNGETLHVGKRRSQSSGGERSFFTAAETEGMETERFLYPSRSFCAILKASAVSLWVPFVFYEMRGKKALE
jgi:hypothetical protein